MTREQAARTAGESLARIEQWARRTFFTTLAVAIFAGILAALGLYAGAEYLRARAAMEQASARLSEMREQIKASMPTRRLSSPTQQSP